MRPMRLVVGYLYRTAKRRFTIILLVSFITVLTIIFQIYHRREISGNSTLYRLGNYDYNPGSFLQNVQPSENSSFCQFNNGLPEKINWGAFKIHYTPELGPKSAYKVIYNVIEGMAYANMTKYDAVTYATQATPEFLYHIVEIARYWEGPISLAVFVPSTDLDLTIQIMSHLCRCYSGMSKVSMHIFYPQRLPPIVLKHETPNITEEQEMKNHTEDIKRKINNLKTFGNKTRAEYVTMVRQMKIKRMVNKQEKNVMINFKDCASPDLSNLMTFRKYHHMVYPINVGRNVARNASTTNYFIVSDIEMVPSDKLASKFTAMLNKLMGLEKRKDGCIFTRSVFVVPLFEVERGEDIPRDKETLVSLVAANRATYFHQKTCSHCQRFPGLQSWLSRPSIDYVEPMLVGKREYPYHRWEPLYFGTRQEPWYSEALSWEGRQDKMAQMAELCLLEYRLLVLDGGFLCHASSVHPPARRARPERANALHYAAILKYLRHKYKDRPQCNLDRLS